MATADEPAGQASTAESEHDGSGAACSEFHTAVELIGRRWNGVILQCLFDGPQRFSELRDRIPRITDAMLSQRLKEFEAAGIVERVVTIGRPVEIRYHLTDIGRRLAPVFDAVRSWSAAWSAGRSTV